MIVIKNNLGALGLQASLHTKYCEVRPTECDGTCEFCPHAKKVKKPKKKKKSKTPTI